MAKSLNADNSITLLDKIYSGVLQGIPKISQPIEAFANDYLSKNPDKESAVKSMMHNQIVKCTTTGIATGFGGLITLPVTIPADLSSSLYIQMRMIACTAYIYGYDVHSDQVKTLVYACLVGLSVKMLQNNLVLRLG